MTGMDGSTPASLRNEAEQGIATVMLPMHVDSSTAPEVERIMVRALQPSAKVIVDGSRVTYMSAAGVRALASALREAAAREAHIVFCRFSGPAADCLMVSGFSQLLDIAQSVEEARARLRPGLSATDADRLHPRGTAG
ncbi:MAG TPA: STAS domain-containing protein [Reyranella sp.]|nr:STAS domain-containing protein [Reyranella sp.]